MRSIPFWAVCGIIFVIPWEEMAFIAEIETVAKSIGYIAVFLSLLVIVIQFRIRRPPLAMLPLGLAVAWNCASILWTVDAETSATRELTNLSLFAFAWMVWEFGESEDRVSWMLRSYLAGCCIALTTMFLSFAPGAIDQFGELARYTGGDLNANDVAAILNIAIPFAVFLASRTARGKRMRIAYWLFIPPAAIGVLLTGSRMGIVILGLNLCMIGVTVLTKGFRLLIPFVIVVGIAAWLVPHFASEQVFERVAEGTEASSFKHRVRYWQAGLEFWQGHPVQGAGAGAYKTVTELQGAVRPNVSHNTFVTILVEGGLVGAALMLTFWALALRSIWRLPKRDRLLWLTVFGIWIGSSMSITWECAKTTWFLYGLVMAFCALPKSGSTPKPTIRVQRPPLTYRGRTTGRAD
jgi:O-antigen ligase